MGRAVAVWLLVCMGVFQERAVMVGRMGRAMKSGGSVSRRCDGIRLTVVIM